MGQEISRLYPASPNVNSHALPVNVNLVTRQSVPGRGELEFDSESEIDTLGIRKEQMLKLLRKLETNLNMYALYDNYQHKNDVMLIDLKKKSKIQDEELKELIESRDKLKSIFDTKRSDAKEYSTDAKTLNYTNIVLFIILIASIVFMLYKLYYYPIPEESSNNNVSDLLDLSNNDLSDLSIEDLNKLEKEFDAKINDIQLNNNIDFSPRMNSTNNNIGAGNRNNGTNRNNAGNNGTNKNNAGNNANKNNAGNNANKNNAGNN
jgi:hypothetical protein